MWYSCADVALTRIIGNCAREKISVRNRTSGGTKETKEDKERRKACGKKEKDEQEYRKRGILSTAMPSS